MNTKNLQTQWEINDIHILSFVYYFITAHFNDGKLSGKINNRIEPKISK